MIQIFTDTSANLPAAYIQKYSLRVIPLTYFVDGAEAHQDPAVDFDGKAYYDAMRSGTPVSTAMINLAAFLEPLHAALAAGDDVIYIGMSGGISGTAQAAVIAAGELTENTRAEDRHDRHLRCLPWRGVTGARSRAHDRRGKEPR